MVEETKTALENLASESNFDNFNNKICRKEIDLKILDFLSEDSIIERTRNCQTYFAQHVPAQTANTKVGYLTYFCYQRILSYCFNNNSFY